jgi:hypothetical protein
MNPRVRRPVGQQVATPRRAKAPRSAPGLALPHERDESSPATAQAPDPLMVQAKRDIDAGMVDTDMRATPGLDAELRARLVPGPGGKPPATTPVPASKTLAEQKADFTAEGSPPPGKVSTSLPVSSPDPGRASPLPAPGSAKTRRSKPRTP